MEQEEIWKDIEGYEGLYQVSNMGKVRSVDRIDCTGHRLNGKILRPRMNSGGYLLVNLHNEGEQKTFTVHRLVAQAFIPNPEGLPQINHKDEDKTNNIVDNIEYCDRKYNCNYGTRNERVAKNMLQTKISKGLVDPEMCGIQTKDKKEYNRLYYNKKRDQILEQQRAYRRRKKNKITA